MNLAVIPARGGSKRIPRKNIKSFCGKPIMAWSIEAARDCGCFNSVIVSTDDGEIAQVARECGASVPFVRPAALADDYIGTIEVVRHAIEWQIEHGQAPELVCCIYATAPFVCAADLKRGLNALKETGCDYAFSVACFGAPIQRAIRITEQGRVDMFYPEFFDSRSQDLEQAYHDAGQFYWGRTAAWLAKKRIFSADAVPVLLPRHRVQDIDTADDWMRAELMFRSQQTDGLHVVRR